MSQCPMCKKNPVIEGVKDVLWPDFCSECRKKIQEQVKRKHPAMLEKLENKIKRRNW